MTDTLTTPALRPDKGARRAFNVRGKGITNDNKNNNI